MTNMRTRLIELVPHPASPALPVTVEARCIATDEGALSARFVLHGPLSALRVPPRSAVQRLDGLWRHTCFELFLGHAGGSDYLEYNLSPSQCWAAYAFSAYRVPAPLPAVTAPRIEVDPAEAVLTLDVELGRGALERLGHPPVLEVGLTAVVEAIDGSLAHYALHHPRPEADFHDARGFALRVPLRALG
jgi:hypothetical protein